MTHQEQLEIENLNKAILQKLKDTVKAEDFINFYINHNQKETMEAFGIRNVKQLRKALELFNYNFNTKKPSKFKGQKAARSHESYVAGGAKSRKTQKQHWNEKSDVDKIAWSVKMAEAHATDEFKSKISQINIDYQASLSAVQREELRKKKSAANKKTWDENKAAILAKAYNTKKKNKSFKSSKAEDRYFLELLKIYSEEDITRQYKESRYQHACDFYIGSKDLFIELNFDWTHGYHPFDPQDAEDLAKLTVWQTKAQEGSKFYAKAIETWTRLDVQKFKDAKENNLNYIVFYTEKDAYAWLTAQG